MLTTMQRLFYGVAIVAFLLGILVTRVSIEENARSPGLMDPRIFFFPFGFWLISGLFAVAGAILSLRR